MGVWGYIVKASVRLQMMQGLLLWKECNVDETRKRANRQQWQGD